MDTAASLWMRLTSGMLRSFMGDDSMDTAASLWGVE